MSKTEEQYKRELAKCRKMFEMKAKDYGTSWRILRLSSLTDQIYIKANRIRSVQIAGESKVDENFDSCFEAMVNYSVIALIQCELGIDGEQELPLERAMELYDRHSTAAMRLMLDKNHDYGEAWREMRISSMVDIILMKIKRIKQIEDNQGHTLVSEGVEGNYSDILNYAMFCLILMHEND